MNADFTSKCAKRKMIVGEALFEPSPPRWPSHWRAHRLCSTGYNHRRQLFDSETGVIVSDHKLGHRPQCQKWTWERLPDGRSIHSPRVCFRYREYEHVYALGSDSSRSPLSGGMVGHRETLTLKARAPFQHRFHAAFGHEHDEGFLALTERLLRASR